MKTDAKMPVRNFAGPLFGHVKIRGAVCRLPPRAVDCHQHQAILSGLQVAHFHEQTDWYHRASFVNASPPEFSTTVIL